MNVVDSSAWIAFFADTKNALKFSKPISDVDRLIVPTIVMYEVFKVICREHGEESAIVAQAHMQQGTVVDLDSQIAVSAANISLQYHLPMADSIILATARHYGAEVWTQDDDFKGLGNVKYFAA